MIITIDVDPTTITGVIIAACAAIPALLAAVSSIRNHGKIQQLQVLINGRVDRLLEEAHAAGRLEEVERAKAESNDSPRHP